MNWWCYPEDEGTTGSTDREKWDKNAAANLATLMYEGNAADYVVTGFDVSVDAGEATVSPGLARVSDVSANDHTEDEVRDWGVTYAVGLSDPVTVPVSDGDTLHIAFDATQGDGGSIETNGAAVGIEIASIESGAAVPTNRNPSAAFQDASVETAPSSPTDVARKQEVDENATTIGGKADDPHGDAAHSEDYAKTGESQPPEGHDNTAHTEQYAVDGNTQPPETHGDTEHDATVPSQTEVDGKADDPHGSEAHSEDYAVDGDAQPPETHGDTEHDTTVPSTSDVDAVSTDLSGHEAADGDVHGVVSPDTVAGKSDVDDHEASTGDVHGVAAGDSVASQSDVDGKASDPHDNAAHSETYAVDGTPQPPETHGDGDHDATVPGFDADVSEFSGAAGTADQILGTDGAAAFWTDPEGGGVATTETVKSGFNQIYKRLGAHDFELGLQMIDYKNGLYDIYADSSKIASSVGVDLSTLGSEKDGDGYVKMSKDWEYYGSVGHSGPVDEATQWVDTSADGSRVLVATDYNAGSAVNPDYTTYIDVYDASTRSSAFSEQLSYSVEGLTMSEDGQYVAWGDYTTNTFYWLNDDGTTGSNNRGDSLQVCETSRDSQWLVVFSYENNREYQVYDRNDLGGAPVAAISTSGNAADPESVAFTTNDEYMIIRDRSEVVRVYETGTFSEVTSFTDGDDPTIICGDGWLAYFNDANSEIIIREVGNGWGILNKIPEQYFSSPSASDDYLITWRSPDVAVLNPFTGETVSSLPTASSPMDISTHGDLIAYEEYGNERYTRLNSQSYAATGSVTHTKKNIEFPPTSVVLSQDATVPTGTSLTYEISDNSGNSLLVDQTSIDEEIQLGFADGDIQVRLDLESDTNNELSPTVNNWATYFDEA